MSAYPKKPQVCILDGKLAVFMGGAYQLLDAGPADVFTRAVQSANHSLQRQVRKARREARRAAREHQGSSHGC